MPAYSWKEPSAAPRGSADVIEVTASVVEVAPVADMFWKALVPEKVLLFARSVEDAAEMVIDPPAESVVPFTVASVPVKRLVPIVVVETSCLFGSSARRVEAL